MTSMMDGTGRLTELELMQLDTKKHIAVLQFIRRVAETDWAP